MVHWQQFAVHLLSFVAAPWSDPSLRPIASDLQTSLGSYAHQHNVTKSIAIVGSGSAGLAILKTLLDLPEEVRSTWDIVLYEQRRSVGGVWLEDPVPPHPPTLPETPLYPRLHTNTPHPTMTYPGFTFPPGTPLFPSHEYMWKYHQDFVDKNNLTQYLRLNHTVVAAAWNGDSVQGQWEVEVARTDRSQRAERAFFDHLIVANGHNHYPRAPHWDGQEDWLANTPVGSPKREILHSIFYREPERYANRTVVIVGGGASGRDAALQVGPITTTYQSLNEGSVPPDGAPVIVKPPISHFTNSSVVFSDGSSLSSVDSLILATGYRFLVPFLSRIPSRSTRKSPALITDAKTQSNSTTAPALTSNTRYIFPLYEHVLSLSPEHPPTALAFVGLPVLIANCPSDIAQSLFIAHAIADPSILPQRGAMLDALVTREQSLSDRGYDPYYYGHKMVGGDDEAQDYQNSLVRYLKVHGKLPNDGKDYVEQWRRTARRDSRLMARAWTRVQERGEEQQWLEGVETEEEWADLMTRLTLWQEKWEQEHGQQGRDLYDAV